MQADAAGVPLADCYLGVDDEPAPLHEVVAWLRERLGVSHWSDEQRVRRAGSKRCSNARARALGWAPQYPSYREGYAAVSYTHLASYWTCPVSLRGLWILRQAWRQHMPEDVIWCSDYGLVATQPPAGGAVALLAGEPDLE